MYTKCTVALEGLSFNLVLTGLIVAAVFGIATLRSQKISMTNFFAS